MKHPYFAGALILASGLVCGRAAAIEIALPPETVSYRPAELPGYQLALRHCLLCHSAHYVQTQPPSSPRAYWEATVRKMKKPFGAQVPEEDIPALVDYLSRTYGAEQGVVPTSLAADEAPEKKRRILSTVKRVVIRKAIVSP